MPHTSLTSSLSLGAHGHPPSFWLGDSWILQSRYVSSHRLLRGMCRFCSDWRYQASPTFLGHSTVAVWLMESPLGCSSSSRLMHARLL
ncbi:hypothetical protein K431DRAFT_58328 [Polychaeton citri CBS 116435]|uniref:Uncharacterized protein n=1 Tax=Polychaeton citri CBS 116435 TaxID=1314669 RepID=A0A9P4Q7X7_9PEZI|nr:hypothetical protein K431DRAFT_58328 [Polychaeton citri CBS 116435]